MNLFLIELLKSNVKVLYENSCYNEVEGTLSYFVISGPKSITISVWEYI